MVSAPEVLHRGTLALYYHGFAVGLAKARGEGEAEALADAVLWFLERRYLAITTEHVQRITACTDLAVLRRWLDRACAVSSVDELFA